MSAATARTVISHKLVLLGDTSVGKSCLVVRFCRGEYFDYQEPTIGAAFLTQTVQLEDCIIRFELWDTAGQERYRSLAPMYYRGASAAVVVFDVTSRDSFNGAMSWITELQRRGDPHVVIALAGNKADVREGRAVSVEEAMDYAKEKGVIYMDTSAKTGYNVKEIFISIARKLPRAKERDLDVLPDLADDKGGKGGKAAGDGKGCC